MLDPMATAAKVLAAAFFSSEAGFAALLASVKGTKSDHQNESLRGL